MVAVGEFDSQVQVTVEQTNKALEQTNKALEDGLRQTNKALEQTNKVLEDGLRQTNKATKKRNKKLDAVTAGLSHAFDSVGAGLREAAAGGPVRALVAASAGDIAAWLAQEGFPQYVPALAHLSGAALLLQTPTSLALAGVAPHHVALLLERVAATACAHGGAHAGGRSAERGMTRQR